MSNVKRAYSLKLALATLAASIAAGTFWVSQNMQMPHAERWEDGAIAAGLVAVILAVWATRQAPAARPKPATSFQQPDRSTSSTLRRQFVEAAKASKAEKPETNTTAPTPKTDGQNTVEAKRAELREKGLTDYEISQILIAQQSGTAGRSSYGSGVASGVLNNLDAIVTHVKSLIPSFRSDLTSILDRNAGTGERLGSAMSLVIKTAAVIVLGYFVYLEALQVRSMAYKSWAEACIERQKNAINFTPMNELLNGSSMSELDKECRS